MKTEWKEYEPTTAVGEAYFRRVGDRVEIIKTERVKPSTHEEATIEMPAGLSIDYTKLNPNAKLGSSIYTYVYQYPIAARLYRNCLHYRYRRWRGLKLYARYWENSIVHSVETLTFPDYRRAQLVKRTDRVELPVREQ